MEWVETTGRSVAEALEAALDELGVHEDDVEFEVIDEPKSGFLGRLGGSDARIRVRIKPLSREKPTDRRRRKGSRSPRNGKRDDRGNRGDRAKRSSNGSGKQQQQRSGRTERQRTEGDMGEVTAEVPIERQAESASDFADGLVEAFGLDAEVRHEIDDDTIFVNIEGPELGLLVGPKGATLSAIEELARAVLQKETGGHGARLRIDIAGYRARRREALEDFVRGLVETVRENDKPVSLEPMNASDRKIVHDTVSELDGVETTSEGEEPRRRVVIRPS